VANERGDKLVLEAGSLRYVNHDREVWRFAVKELVVAGEWTDDHGPADDYFYFFIAGRPATVFEAPMYANPGLPEELSAVLGSPLRSGLAQSTTFKSRVMWPAELAGTALFKYSPERRGPGLLNRALDKILPLVHSELAEDVVRFVQAGEAR
jgi:hypothetical protein